VISARDDQLKEEAIVSFVLLCTDSPSPSKKVPVRCREVAVDSDSMGVAINAACRLIDGGVTVWKLLGATGFSMERSDIEVECLRRQGAMRCRGLPPGWSQ
jgi:hypothetical protein